MFTIDKYDLAILDALQREGRVTHGNLTDRVHLSASQISRRVQRLEEAGVISGYLAHLDSALIGLGVTAFTFTSIERHDQSQRRTFEQSIAHFPEVLECFSVSGEYDYLLRIVATDLKSFSRFMMDELMCVPGIQTVKSHITFGQIKKSQVLPLAHLTRPQQEKKSISFDDSE